MACMVHLPRDCVFDIVSFLAQDPTFDAAVLMRVSREWFSIAGPILYANPARRILLMYKSYDETMNAFSLLLDTLRHSTPLGDPKLERHIPLARVSSDSLLEGPLTINYLEWVIHFDKDWGYLQHQYLCGISSPLADVTVCLLRQHAESVQHLFLEASCVGEAYPLVPNLSRVRTLELAKVETWIDASNALWFASALSTTHGALIRFKLDAKNHELPLGGKFLDLEFLGPIREIALGGWSGAVQLARLPTSHLRHLDLAILPCYSAQQLGTLFDSCPQLESLVLSFPATYGLESPKQSFSNAFSPVAQKRLPRLCALHLKGSLSIVPRGLEDMLAVWGGQLESLTVELIGGRHEDYRSQIAWSVPLPRLRRLSLLDKTMFAFDGNSMRHCPYVTILTVKLFADRGYFKCALQWDRGILKWIPVSRKLHAMNGHLGNLKELHFRGRWAGGCRFYTQFLAGLTNLERLFLGPGMMPEAEPILDWIKTMPKLRYAALPNIGNLMWRADGVDTEAWLPAFEREGLVVEVQAWDLDWHADLGVSFD